MKASLYLKLTLSHLGVLLLAVGVTVAANYVLFRKGFDQRMQAETQVRATEAVASLCADPNGAPSRWATLLARPAADTPVKFSLVPLSAPSREGSGFFQFPLSQQQKDSLTRGHSVSGPIGPENKGVGPGHFCAVLLACDRDWALVAYAVRLQVPLGKPVAAWILQSLVLALLPAALVAVLLARHLVDPIKIIQAATAKVAQGDYTARSCLRRADELGAVSRDFDRMAQKLEADFQIRTRLLGDISHELGTPVTTLRATAEALIDGLIQEPKDLRFCHESILRQVEHLSILVCDVTQLAQYETGEVSFFPRPFPAEEPVRQAVDSAYRSASQKDSRLEISAQKGICLGDQRRILQVLKNLIHNAIDHNPAGTTIWVDCWQQPDGVHFRVEDDGVSIPADQHDSIFHRFTKLDPSRPRAFGSGGLGLAIVREILQAHQSEVTVSETHRGKAFCFTLPLAPRV